jgi:hypothetical protein
VPLTAPVVVVCANAAGGTISTAAAKPQIIAKAKPLLANPLKENCIAPPQNYSQLSSPPEQRG